MTINRHQLLIISQRHVLHILSFNHHHYNSIIHEFIIHYYSQLSIIHLVSNRDDTVLPDALSTIKHY